MHQNVGLQSAFLLRILIVVWFSIVATSYAQNSDDWEVLIFTQHWPITVCLQWEEKGKSNNCAFPPNLWTIHGIWPTRAGGNSPMNCNKTWHFDPAQLQPIETNLEKYWTNVESNTQLYSFWKHEWVKHGTCAASLLQLNSEFKYFNQGLTWIPRYDITTILSKTSVKPNKVGYSVQDISNAIKSVIKKNPIIQCVTDKKVSFISEIRLCFDKTLNLMDCDIVKKPDEGQTVLTNCNLGQPVIYPNELPPITTTQTTLTTQTQNFTTETTVPPIEAEFDTMDEYFTKRNRLIYIYKAIQRLIWTTI